ncbi:MAG TPA: hypothetical protein VD866_01050, partial [Urbifossiella sp.]|nr:hypothetical protein [Urbifossiella sp.]
MALATLIAGRMSGVYNSVDVGITRQGHEVEIQLKAEVIDESDLFGLSMIDAIHRGGDAFYNAVFREYKAGSISILTRPFGGTLGLLTNAANPMGVLLSDKAQALVLTATASTPAALTPATLTASKSILAENYPVKIVHDSRLKELPIRMRL